MSKIADLMLMAAGGAGGNPLDLTFYESRYGATMGTVNVYLVDTSGNIQGSAVYTASGDDGLTGGWAQRTASAVGISDTFRIAWHYVSGTDFTGDYAIDTVSLQGTSLNFDSNNDSFVCSTSDTSSSTTALSGATPVATATTNARWNRHSGGTGSSETGPTAAQSGSFYLYCEASFNGHPNTNFWLFSPEVTEDGSIIFTNPAFVGATSVSGASSLDAGTITGAAIGDTFILAAMDDSTIFAQVSALGWSGMTSGFPNTPTENSIDHVVCTRVNTGSGNTVITQNDDDEAEAVDAICAVAFRNMGTPPSTPSASQSASGTSFSLPSMDVSEAGSTAVIIAMIDDDDATISSVPTGYTLAVQNGRAGGSMAIMYQLDLSPGLTPSADGSWSSSDALYTIGYIIPPAA